MIYGILAKLLKLSNDKRKGIHCYRCNTFLDSDTQTRCEPGMFVAETTTEIKCSKCGWVWYGEAWMWEKDAYKSYRLRGKML